MTTHCSPVAGATTQQLVCQGPAGNPTTSTDVLPDEVTVMRTQLPPAEPIQRAVRPATENSSLELPGCLTRGPVVPAPPSEDLWQTAVVANASSRAVATSGAACASSSSGPGAGDATRSS